MNDLSIRSGAVRLAIKEFGGRGQVILLLHGAGRSCADWIPMAQSLTGCGTVIALDLRGHGRSDAGIWDYDSLLLDIDAVLTKYGAGDATIIGHSMGGVLAHLFAAQYGGIRHVVNLDGFALHANDYFGISPAAAIEGRERADREWDWSSPILKESDILAEVQNITDRKASETAEMRSWSTKPETNG